ncbi:MAG: hypothetical protein R6U98_23425, partial [Pirellulaceae bacterium]
MMVINGMGCLPVWGRSRLHLRQPDLSGLSGWKAARRGPSSRCSDSRRTKSSATGIKGIVALLAIAIVHIPLGGRLHGYTPESPEVRRMAAAAMAYLEEHGKTQEGQLLGGEALVGLAAYKYNRRFGNDPRALPQLTQGALERVVREVGRSKANRSRNYTLGIVLMLLSEVQSQQHISTTQAYLAELLDRQKPHGGWGYMTDPHQETGDLSQLQYAVLGLWSARDAGLEVPNRSMVDVVNYVIRVQDPEGGWAYQGRDPMTRALGPDPSNYSRQPQPSGDIKRARTAAGLGSLYVGADFLGLADTRRERAASSEDLPPALVPVRGGTPHHHVRGIGRRRLHFAPSGSEGGD